MNLCKHFMVDGFVQGVFYRASTQQVAQRLGLTGWVRNCDDGHVELVACGTQEKLAELEAWLWEGPVHANVKHVLSEEMDLQPFNGFQVRY
ncbi:MAG: acylphosphatase [Gammaproteobacteria bacterium]|nr:acylphosphatase [Gammaproteobacteria bacterium]